MVSYKVFGLDARRPEECLFLLLLVLCFTIAITTGTWDLGNSQIVMTHELVFMGAYFLLLRHRAPIFELIRAHPWIVGLLLVWLVSISLSLYFSPLGLRHLTIARARYYETITHIAFFAVLLSYFRAYELPLRKLLAVILLSYVVVALQALMVWHFSPDPNIHTRRMWVHYFPFTGHIRHGGFNFVVAVLSGVFLYLMDGQPRIQRAAVWCGLIVVLSCLIWMGGRGSMLALALGTCLIAWKSQLYRYIPKIHWVLLALALIISVFISHQLSVFQINGLWNSVGESLGADSANQLFSGRLAIWACTLEVVGDHWVLGLGPQGYMLMPECRRMAMPHNMFVQFLLEWGLVGTMLFVALLARLMHAGWQVTGRAEKSSMAALAGGAIAVALTLYGLTDGTYYHGKPGFYLALSFGLWIAVNGSRFGGGDDICHCGVENGRPGVGARH